MINIFLVIYDKYYALLIFREKRQEKVYTKIKFYFFFFPINNDKPDNSSFALIS